MTTGGRSTAERLDEVEHSIEQLNLELVRIKTQMEGQKSTIDSIDGKLDGLLLEMSRYRGLVGGILLVASCIATFIKMVGVEWFTRK